MSNYVVNKLIIIGKDEEKKKLKKFLYNDNDYSLRSDNIIKNPTEKEIEEINYFNFWNNIPMYEIGTSMMFHYAYKSPEITIKHLSKEFPTLKLRVSFADEDYGRNNGVYEYKNGELISFKEKKDNVSFSKKLFKEYGWV